MINKIIVERNGKYREEWSKPDEGGRAIPEDERIKNRFKMLTDEKANK